jgi:uncharacterized CHY-type Zn-finger protein
MQNDGPQRGDRAQTPPLSHALARESGEPATTITSPASTTVTQAEPIIPRNRAHTVPSRRPDEDDTVDVLNELIGGNYVRRPPIERFASHYSAFAGWSGSTGMSANPAREVEESLRSFELISEVDGNSVRSERSESGSERRSFVQDMEYQAEPQGQAVDGSRDKMDSALPANDGMHELRQQLHEIRKLAISTEEKAMRMHALMMQDYMTRHGGNTSPLSLGGGDASSLSDEPAALDVGLAALPIDPSNPYNVRPGDLVPTLSPLPPTVHQNMEDSTEEMDAFALGCMHYKRNVKVQCFDCHRWFPCRYCHDQSQDLPFPHQLRRKMTRNMLCMLCQTPQPAADKCVSCEEYAAYYYCPKCKLWDNDSNKRIYHCDDCGICRLGEGLGKDFAHCKKCDVCLSMATFSQHICVENATKGPCPLCLDEMFASRAKVVSLPCGHYMHGECYRDLMAVTYKCPVCSKSAVNMELQWRKLDDEIRAQPMPEDDEELRNLLPHLQGQETPNDEGSQPQTRRPRKVWIGCNDCNNRCWTAFHWLGLKCQHCDSYNTNQMAPTAGHVESEAERLIRQQQTPLQQVQITGNAVLRDAGIGEGDQEVRADSALEVPASPSFLAVPASPGSPSSHSGSSGLPSPRRYFVRDDEPRRPSFTSPYFSTPTLPTLPNLPEMPRLPRMPDRLPRMPNFPNMPVMPNLPNMPEFGLPHIPDFNLPNMPEFGRLPNMPEFGRFSPYQMFDSLSRSFSPMRYYLQGLDVGEDMRRDPRGRARERRASRLSVRSDPTADATIGKVGGDDDLWVTDDESEEEGEGEGARGRNRDVEDDDEDDEESESESEETDAEMVDDDEAEGADVDEMELFGHR